MKCPHCKKEIAPSAIAREFASIGGKVVTAKKRASLKRIAIEREQKRRESKLAK
jgi:hypothetical protein